MTGLGDFNWTAAGAWGAFLTLLGIIVRQVGPWRKQSIDAEKEFRDGLLRRVERLEETLEAERTERRIERERIEAERQTAQARHEAEQALNRHRINNLQACFDGLMMMLKASPQNVTEIIVHIEKLRAEQMKAEAVEKAAIHAAMMGGGHELER